MDWVIHVDTDELMYPAGAAEFSLQVLFFSARPKRMLCLQFQPAAVTICARRMVIGLV